MNITSVRIKNETVICHHCRDLLPYKIKDLVSHGELCSGVPRPDGSFRFVCFTLHIVCQHCIRNVPNDMDSVLQHCASCYQVDRPDSSYKYVCPLCTRHTSNIAHMRQHIFAHFNVKPFKCTLYEHPCVRCKKKLFCDTNLMLEHSKVCSKITRPDISHRYVCHLCDYHTANSGHMKYHFNKHFGLKPFKCTYCSYSSTQSSNLNMHMNVMHS
ncbi:hypothetical protein M8J75_009079 [Diaphorina citri]|nr:hypothetical protein M8J75_009079 [Diaphorina citri]